MDLKLNEITHDLEVVNYDLALNNGNELVRQRLKQSLWFFLGEWYLDVTDGVPYYRDIFIKSPVQITVESILKTTILETPDVLELTEFSLEYENTTRQLSLTFTVKTTFGTLTMSEEL